MRETFACIKINNIIEQTGWRFFPDAHGPANIQLESNTKITDQAPLTVYGVRMNSMVEACR